MSSSSRPPADFDRQRDLFRTAFRDAGIDRTVLITGSYRAGTSFICSLLKANGLPEPGKELFSRFFDLRYANPEVDFETRMAQSLRTARDGIYATKIMWPHRNNLAIALGFDRGQCPDFAAMFPNAKWINIVRQDKIAQAISFHKAKQSNRWHVYKKDGEEPEVDYDAAAIRKSMSELSIHDMLWRDFHDRAGTNPHHVVYEEFLEDVPGNLTRMVDFLGPDHIDRPDELIVSSRLRKQRNAQSEDFTERFLDDCYRSGH